MALTEIIKPATRHSYQVINSMHLFLLDFHSLVLDNSTDLLRVIRKGPAVKSAVDDAIDQCSTVYNLRDAIEDARLKAEEVTDEKQKRLYTSKG